MGYSESSKDYQIYILGRKHIEVRKYVMFEEDIAFI